MKQNDDGAEVQGCGEYEKGEAHNKEIKRFFKLWRCRNVHLPDLASFWGGWAVGASEISLGTIPFQCKLVTRHRLELHVFIDSTQPQSCISGFESFWALTPFLHFKNGNPPNQSHGCCTECSMPLRFNDVSLCVWQAAPLVDLPEGSKLVGSRSRGEGM